MTMLEVALDCARRGWHVFPCWPRTKKPMTAHGKNDATTDEARIRAWWANEPNANVAISCGPSGLAVLDIDHGIQDKPDAILMLAALGIPNTYMVRTGRRPEYGLQVYFEGAIPDVGLWKAAGAEGQVKSLGGYVMAAESIHPSGERYEVIEAAPLAPTPGSVRALKKAEGEAFKVEPGKKIAEGAGRHHYLTSIAGGLRAKGLDADAIYEALLPINAAMLEVPIPDEEVAAIARSVTRLYAPNAPEPEVVLGTTKAEKPIVRDWRDYFHTADEMENAPELTFLIDGFMHVESITGLAAPAGQRKSLIALNIAHSLCTGEPLFGRFAVVEKPKRVLYLCPEMGMRSFRKRVRSIGLMPYVGKTFFCRTMNKEENHLRLAELSPEALDGAVVIVDTAIRYIEGDESKSEDMKKFAAQLYRLIPHGDVPGAAAVLVLYHSGKGTVKESNELTLENVLRGSSELGAALTCCWGTKLQESDDPTASVFQALSYIKCVKPRDFEDEPKPFEVFTNESCRMTYIESESVPVLKVRARGNVANKDGKDEAADAIIRANLHLSAAKLVALLAEHGIKRGLTWVKGRKAALQGTGVRVTESG